MYMPKLANKHILILKPMLLDNDVGIGIAQHPAEPLQASDPCITPWLSSGIHTLCHVASTSCLVLSMFGNIHRIIRMAKAIFVAATVKHQ